TAAYSCWTGRRFDIALQFLIQISSVGRIGLRHSTIKNAECIIGKQYLCQTAMVIMGLGLLSVSAAQGYDWSRSPGWL
ncbi:hypothetical protein AVEN_149762-1, partial [Araneus ventricosus]